MRLVILAIAFAIATSGCKRREDQQLDMSEEDSLLVGDYLFVAKDDVRERCPPGTFLLTHEVSSLAHSIANDEPFDLSNDPLALSLLDSMSNASSRESRRFHFWVVTKSLKHSDGYYAEGVGAWGSEFLFNKPTEFLDAWGECISDTDQVSWAWYLAAEENIESEGYPVDDVMKAYRKRLHSATMDLPNSLLSIRSLLLHRIDSIYHELAKDDRPINSE